MNDGKTNSNTLDEVKQTIQEMADELFDQDNRATYEVYIRNVTHPITQQVFDVVTLDWHRDNNEKRIAIQIRSIPNEKYEMNLLLWGHPSRPAPYNEDTKVTGIILPSDTTQIRQRVEKFLDIYEPYLK
ncbi:MAG: hypothetical protein AAFR67_07405 [Chloroflexota bacterium]